MQGLEVKSDTGTLYVLDVIFYGVNVVNCFHLSEHLSVHSRK